MGSQTLSLKLQSLKIQSRKMIKETYLRNKRWNVKMKYISFCASLQAALSLVSTLRMWIHSSVYRKFSTKIAWKWFYLQRVFLCLFSFKSKLSSQESYYSVGWLTFFWFFFFFFTWKVTWWLGYLGHFFPQDIWTNWKWMFFILYCCEYAIQQYVETFKTN